MELPKKSYKPPGIDFFNSVVVSNWRLCVSKLLVLVKVRTPIRTTNIPLIGRFPLSSRKFVDIYSKNVWESRQCMILHLRLIKCKESTTINLISVFAFSTTCFCLKTNRSDLSFAVQKLNVQWNVLICKENLFHTSIQGESKQLSLAKKSRRCYTFFISDLSIHKRNDNVGWLAAFSHTINESYWNSLSK